MNTVARILGTLFLDEVCCWGEFFGFGRLGLMVELCSSGFKVLIEGQEFRVYVVKVCD